MIVFICYILLTVYLLSFIFETHRVLFPSEESKDKGDRIGKLQDIRISKIQVNVKEV